MSRHDTFIFSNSCIQSGGRCHVPGKARFFTLVIPRTSLFLVGVQCARFIEALISSSRRNSDRRRLTSVLILALASRAREHAKARPLGVAARRTGLCI